MQRSSRCQQEEGAHVSAIISDNWLPGGPQQACRCGARFSDGGLTINCFRRHATGWRAHLGGLVGRPLCLEIESEVTGALEEAKVRHGAVVVHEKEVVGMVTRARCRLETKREPVHDVRQVARIRKVDTPRSDAQGRSRRCRYPAWSLSTSSPAPSS